MLKALKVFKLILRLCLVHFQNPSSAVNYNGLANWNLPSHFLLFSFVSGAVSTKFICGPSLSSPAKQVLELELGGSITHRRTAIPSPYPLPAHWKTSKETPTLWIYNCRPANTNAVGDIQTEESTSVSSNPPSLAAYLTHSTQAPVTYLCPKAESNHSCDCGLAPRQKKQEKHSTKFFGDFSCCRKPYRPFLCPEEQWLHLWRFWFSITNHDWGNSLLRNLRNGTEKRHPDLLDR